MDDSLDAARIFVKQAMEATGLDATNLARRAKLAPSTLTRLLNGASKNAPGYRTIAKIAEVAGISVPGHKSAPPLGRTIKLYGYVGAGDSVYPDGASESSDVVEAPLWANDSTCALRVRGDSMFPAYWAGDIVFFDMLDNDDGRVPFFSECVVKLASGEVYIKQVQLSQEQEKYNLLSYNAPPILGVEIDWAKPILFVDRRFRSKHK